MIFIGRPNKIEYIRYGKFKYKIKFDNNAEYKTINPLFQRYLKKIYPTKQQVEARKEQ